MDIWGELPMGAQPAKNKAQKGPLLVLTQIAKVQRPANFHHHPSYGQRGCA